MYKYTVDMPVSQFLTSTILSELNKRTYSITEKTRLDFADGDIVLHEGTSRSNAHSTLNVTCGLYHTDYGRMPLTVNNSSLHAYVNVGIKHSDTVNTLLSKIYQVCVSALARHASSYPRMPSIEENIVEHIQLTSFLQNSKLSGYPTVETRVAKLIDEKYVIGDVIHPSVIELLSSIPSTYIGDGLALMSTTRTGSKFFATLKEGEYVRTEDKQIVDKLKSLVELRARLMD